MIGTTNASGEYKDEVYTYIQDGLMQHYDGIRNLRIGHSNITTRWEDLKGGWDLIDAYGGGYTVQNNSYYFPSRGGLRFETSYNIKPVQVDIAITSLDTTENYLIAGWNSIFPNLYTRSGYLGVGNSGSFGTAISTNTFYTISVLSSSTKIYVNKILAPLGCVSTGNGWESSTRGIGCYSSIDNYSWYGNIYAIRFYNRELTEAEIIYNHNLDIKRFNT